MPKVTIKSTPQKDPWGDGNIQEITLENGDKYTIKSSPLKDPWGNGNIKEIEKVDNTPPDSDSLILLSLAIAGICLTILFPLLMGSLIKPILILGGLVILFGLIVPALIAGYEKKKYGYGRGASKTISMILTLAMTLGGIILIGYILLFLLPKLIFS